MTVILIEWNILFLDYLTIFRLQRKRTVEWLTGKDVEGSGRELHYGAIPARDWRNSGKPRNPSMTAPVFWTRIVPGASGKRSGVANYTPVTFGRVDDKDTFPVITMTAAVSSEPWLCSQTFQQ
jgi:hypothetical protein